MLSIPDGSPRDKLRILLLALLYGGGSPANSVKDITDHELDQLCSLIQSSDDSVSVTAAVRHVRSYRMHTQLNLVSRQAAGPAKPGGLFTKFISHGQAYFMEGVKNFVAKKHVRFVFGSLAVIPCPARSWLHLRLSGVLKMMIYGHIDKFSG